MLIIPAEDACFPCPIRIMALAQFAEASDLPVIARGARAAAAALYREQWILKGLAGSPED